MPAPFHPPPKLSSKWSPLLTSAIKRTIPYLGKEQLELNFSNQNTANSQGVWKLSGNMPGLLHGPIRQARKPARPRLYKDPGDRFWGLHWGIQSRRALSRLSYSTRDFSYDARSTKVKTVTSMTKGSKAEHIKSKGPEPCPHSSESKEVTLPSHPTHRPPTSEGKQQEGWQRMKHFYLNTT